MPTVYPEDYNCVVDPDPTSKCGGIFIGNLEAAQNLSTLRKNGIRAVLTAAKGISLGHSRSHVPMIMEVAGEDREGYDMSQHFEAGVDFIKEALRSTNIMVHCLAGVSRSVSLVMAYLIKYKGYSYLESYGMLKARRKIIHPNPGFVEQLKAYYRRCGTGVYREVLSRKGPSYGPNHVAARGYELNRSMVDFRNEPISLNKSVIDMRRFSPSKPVDYPERKPTASYHQTPVRKPQYDSYNEEHTALYSKNTPNLYDRNYRERTANSSYVSSSAKSSSYYGSYVTGRFHHGSEQKEEQLIARNPARYEGYGGYESSFGLESKANVTLDPPPQYYMDSSYRRDDIRRHLRNPEVIPVKNRNLDYGQNYESRRSQDQNYSVAALYRSQTGNSSPSKVGNRYRPTTSNPLSTIQNKPDFSLNSEIDKKIAEIRRKYQYFGYNRPEEINAARREVQIQDSGYTYQDRDYRGAQDRIYSRQPEFGKASLNYAQ